MRIVVGRAFSLSSAVLIVSLGIVSASAEPLPDGENGRYTLSAVKDGIVRLDTRTGAVSACTDSGNGWACRVVPDERAALDAEIGRLQGENEALKARLAANASPSDKTAGALQQPNKDGERKIEIPKIEIPLPSDRDLDRVMNSVERTWRRLVDMAHRLQRDSGSGN